MPARIRRPVSRSLTPLRSLLAGAAFAALTCAAVALAAPTHTQQASADGITATYTYTGSFPMITGSRLRIVKAGQELYNQPVTSPACGKQCGPDRFGPGASSVGVVPLESRSSPDVVLELFSGGANCCFVDQVFALDPGTMTYVKTEHDFGPAGALIKRLAPGHKWSFVSADGNFKYEFTDGADSGEPLQIWRYRALKFTDVTRQYPKLIGSDASRWLRLFGHHIANGVGLIAAWAADEELLGHDKLVQTTLAGEARQGKLRDGGNGLATGRKFVTALNRLLVKLHYKR